MICTEKECDTESSTLHLCEDHRAELKDLLDNVDFLIVNLDPNIQAGKVVRKPGGQEGGNGTKSAGSRPPTTDTGQLRYWLWELPTNAYTVARDNPNAGQTLHMARIWVGKARDAVYGADDDQITNPEKIKTRLAEEVPEELAVPALVQWLNNVHHLNINSARIWQWAKRKHITRTNETGQAKYSPAAVLIHAQKDRLQRQSKRVKV